jgi:hypothetical protein
MNILKIFSLLALLLKNEKKQNEYCPECGGIAISFKKNKGKFIYLCRKEHKWNEKGTSIFDKRQ